MSRYIAILAYVASTPPSMDLDKDALEAICLTGTMSTQECMAYLNATRAFVTEVLTRDDHQHVYAMAQAVQTEISTMNISMMQYVVRPNAATNGTTEETELLTMPLVSPEDHTKSWHNFFGWIYLCDWVEGNPEVVLFEGYHGRLRLISTALGGLILPPNKAELPRSMSVYFQHRIQYVTIVMLVIAALALFYAVASRGHFAGLNFLDFNRVTGTVWVGRPLLVLRSLVAICILSTGRLVLQHRLALETGEQLVLLDETPQTWFNTILSAGEASWLVYIANDISIVLTQGLHIHTPSRVL